MDTIKPTRQMLHNISGRFVTVGHRCPNGNNAPKTLSFVEMPLREPLDGNFPTSPECVGKRHCDTLEKHVASTFCDSRETTKSAAARHVVVLKTSQETAKSGPATLETCGKPDAPTGASEPRAAHSELERLLSQRKHVDLFAREHRARRYLLRNTNKSSSPSTLSKLRHSRSQNNKRHTCYRHGRCQPLSPGVTVTRITYWPREPRAVQRRNARTCL